MTEPANESVAAPFLEGMAETHGPTPAEQATSEVGICLQYAVDIWP